MSMQMLKGLHRRAVGISNNDQLMATRGLVSGGDGKPAVVHHGPDTVSMWADFLGDTVPPELFYGSSDTGQAAAIQPTLTNGVYRMTSSATSTQTPVGGAQSVNTTAQWKANQGRLRFATRVKIATLAGNTIFAGFTDSGGTEIAAYDTGAGIQTPATDYVGWICSGEGSSTQQQYRFVCGKADVDQSATPSPSVTPVANTYDVLEVEISADGNVATGYINGKAVAGIASAAVTPTVALAAGVWRANTDGAADAVDVDYIHVSAGRDTGT